MIAQNNNFNFTQQQVWQLNTRKSFLANALLESDAMDLKAATSSLSRARLAATPGCSPVKFDTRRE
jgi:hypothetical protein